MADLRSEDRVAVLGVLPRGEVGVMESSAQHEAVATGMGDVAGGLLEPLGRLVRVLVGERSTAAESRDLGQGERVHRRRLRLGGRLGLFTGLGVPGDDAVAHDVEEGRSVVVLAAVARGEQELAELDLHAVADLEGTVLRDLLVDGRDVVVLGLAGPLGRRTHVDELDALVDVVRQVVVVDRAAARVEGSELRWVESVVGHEPEHDLGASGGHVVGDLDLRDALLPVEGEVVVVRGELAFARVSIAGAVGEPGDEGIAHPLEGVRFTGRGPVEQRVDVGVVRTGTWSPEGDEEAEVGSVHETVPVEVGDGVDAAPGAEHEPEIVAVDQSRPVEVPGAGGEGAVARRQGDDRGGEDGRGAVPAHVRVFQRGVANPTPHLIPLPMGSSFRKSGSFQMAADDYRKKLMADGSSARSDSRATDATPPSNRSSEGSFPEWGVPGPGGGYRRGGPEPG